MFCFGNQNITIFVNTNTIPFKISFSKYLWNSLLTYIYPNFLPNPMRGPICWSIRPVSGSNIFMLRSPSSYYEIRDLQNYCFQKRFESMCTVVYCLYYLWSNKNLRNLYFALILLGWVKTLRIDGQHYLEWSGYFISSKSCPNRFLQRKFCRWVLNMQYSMAFEFPSRLYHVEWPLQCPSLLKFNLLSPVI